MTVLITVKRAGVFDTNDLLGVVQLLEAHFGAEGIQRFSDLGSNSGE
jgi:hypothetical protein